MLINLRNALMAGKRLPYDAEVEFLESTGTQYIDTGVVWNRALTVSATVVGLQSTTFAIQTFFGARNLNAANAGYSFGFNSSNRLVSDNSGSRAISSMSYAQGAVYTIVKNLSGCSITNAAGTTENLINNAGTQTATYNLLLFAQNNVGAPATTKCRFYGCKIWDASGVLVRDYIPVRKGTVGYLYDRVSGKLFGNAGTGDFVLGPDVVPVEWLYNSGLTQYINTGYTPTTYTETSLGFEIVSQSSSTAIFGGTDIPNNFAAGYVILRHDTTQGADDYNFRVNHNDAINATLAAGTHDVVMNEHGTRALKVDGTTVGTFSGTLSVSLPIFAFCRNSNGSAQTQYSMPVKLCYLKIKDDSGATVRSMLPVRVGTEGAMMDVLTRRIYRNAGTGAFTYGNDLSYPIPAS